VGTTFTYHAEGMLDIGKQRRTNQDEIILLDDERFYAVSDGMGGLINGGETSALLKSLLPTAVRNARESLGESTDPNTAGEALLAQIKSLAEEVYRQGVEYGPDRFGATLCGVWLIGEWAIFVNIGDSRGYIWSNNELRQVTKDHNIAAHLVERGELTAEEARTHPARTRLLRYVGMKPPVQPDIFIEKIELGYKILVCSDGLYGMLADEEMAKILTSNNEGDVKNLISAANQSGGDDNISVVLIKFEI
jgi:serine/threonine protein phosphatase PrpC